MPSRPASKTSVLYVRKKDAKLLKTRLEQAALLDKRFRMTPVEASAAAGADGADAAAASQRVEAPHDCIAVPVTRECVARTARDATCVNEWKDGRFQWPGSDGDVMGRLVVGLGEYACPHSTKMLGNKRNVTPLPGDYLTIDSAAKDGAASDPLPPLTHVQQALIESLMSWLQDSSKRAEVQTLVRKLSNQTCPHKLEVLGDDGTVVIPRYALFDNTDCAVKRRTTTSSEFRSEKEGTTTSSEFRDLLESVIRMNASEPEGNVARRQVVARVVQAKLWDTLATMHNTWRVVRRGDIDPGSGVRQSGHRLLHPNPPRGDCNRGHLPTETGPAAPGWITVTEHGIRQSFDLTRVMFSRGNVTEKQRFGALVRPGERVLDMYAGIGYYTLPALVHGGAAHVTACEWNPAALRALRHNLRAHGVTEGKGGRVAVLEGDCRVSLRRLLAAPPDAAAPSGGRAACRRFEFDRVSLGLLPSSEGGWALAVRCLDKDAGGWLHVHGNVATAERQAWAGWLCRTLAAAADAAGRARWTAACAHVERVKSFAPRVDHVVADVFVGPRDSTRISDLRGFEITDVCEDVRPPSCALNAGGVLHQSWMRCG